MNDDHTGADTDQITFDELSQSSSSESKWQCTICGSIWTDEETAEACHPLQTRSTQRACTNSPLTFQYPSGLQIELTEFFEGARTEIQRQSEQTPLKPATEYIIEQTPIQSKPAELEALYLYTHLICLQGFGLLREYPRYSRTIEDTTTPIPIDDYCTSHNAVSGKVTDEIIEESPHLETQRVYRSKVDSVTQEFWANTRIKSRAGLFVWKTFSSTTFPDSGYAEVKNEMEFDRISREFEDHEYEITAIFGDGTAHNVIVAEALDWSDAHPALKWTCAPYVMTAPRGVVDYTGIAPIDPPVDPVWMFDFAGFDEDQELRLLGTVIDTESSAEVFDQIKRINYQDVPGVVVMDNRDAIQSFLSHAYQEGWLSGETSPEHYSRQPNILAVVDCVATNIPELSNIRFITRKQLIDDVICPVDVLPELATREKKS